MSFGLFCFILCVGWQHAVSSPITVTEYEHVREADAWLRLHIVPATWSDAAVLCQLEGGVLASPTTGAMKQAMLAAMDKHDLKYSRVFIGVTDLFSKGDFKTLDGLGLANSLDWALGEPDNVGNAEDCLALTSAGAVADVSCEGVLPYFCRKSTQNCSSSSITGDPTDPNISINDVTILTPLVTRCGNDGYNYEPRTSSCYKFHGAAKSWLGALSTCLDEGGYLAIINSKTESSVLEKMYNKYADTITGAQQAKHAFIGFKDVDGEWKTLYGETLAKAGFQGWDIGEPSYGNGNVDEYCGSIHRNGLLNDAGCYDLCPFICEMDPNDVSNNLYF